jgi:hypothetical protein
LRPSQFFWTYQASHIPAKCDQGFAVFFPLWGLMFVLFGLSMLLSPLWAAWTAGSVYYVVTERRAIIFEKKLELNIRFRGRPFPDANVSQAGALEGALSSGEFPIVAGGAHG